MNWKINVLTRTKNSPNRSFGTVSFCFNEQISPEDL